MMRNRLAACGAAILILLLTACSLPGPVVTQAPAADTATQPAPTPIPPTQTASVEATATAAPTDTSQPPTETIAPTATMPPTPASSPVPPAGDYGVILVEEGDVLNVRRYSGLAGRIIADLEPTATGITATGEEEYDNMMPWMEITTPDGVTGWVNKSYLTEMVSSGYFCADPQVTDLLAQFNTAISTNDGELLSTIVSPEQGMFVTYFHSGTTHNYSPEEARFVFESTFTANWGVHPASGAEVIATFHEEVLPKLVEVFSSNYELSCNQIVTGGVSYPTVWPLKYHNINFYSVMKPATPGVEMDWRTWLVGVEYVDAKPYIFSLIQFFWEP